MGMKGYKYSKCPEDHPNRKMVGNYFYILTHRLNAEKIVGRYLKKEEHVHHKDLNPSNNEIDNLMVFASNTDHATFHAYNCDMNTVVRDSEGVYRVRKDIDPPGVATFVCEFCGKEFKDLKSNHKKGHVYCSHACCSKAVGSINAKIRGTNRPDKEQLLQDLSTMSYCAVGRKYGVSDNCIRKWLKNS